jgi:hypothetical protein
MSLAVEVEIESMDTAVKRRTQALIDCGAMGCFIDIEWAKLNNIPTRPLTNPIPVYNVDGTANDAGAITDIADVVLCYENHSECTQLAVTCLGKQSLILGYNWLRNHNPEINWQTKDVKMFRCPLQCSTCRVEDKRDTKRQKSTTSQITTCRSGAFPTMTEEDEDESPHMDTEKTDEEAQDASPAFDDDLDSEVDDLTIEEDDRVFMTMVHPVDYSMSHILSFFTRTIYRVFILLCEYLIRLFSFCVYKRNEKTGISKMMSYQGHILEYKQSERMSRWGCAARLLIELDWGLTWVFAPLCYLYS